jgi:hypothetical protein
MIRVTRGRALVGALNDTLINYREVALTNAQIKALRATPVALVPAPGAGKWNQFLELILFLDYGSNVLTETAYNLLVRYGDGSGTAASQVIECTGFIDQAADVATIGLPVLDNIVTKANGENKALVLHNNGAAEFGGNAAADTLLRAKVAYRVHKTGW